MGQCAHSVCTVHHCVHGSSLKEEAESRPSGLRTGPPTRGMRPHANCSPTGTWLISSSLSHNQSSATCGVGCVWQHPAASEPHWTLKRLLCGYWSTCGNLSPPAAAGRGLADATGALVLPAQELRVNCCMAAGLWLVHSCRSVSLGDARCASHGWAHHTSVHQMLQQC